jgi:hypothetical protein
MEILPQGSNIFTDSFLTKLAQTLSTQSEIDGKPEPDEEYSFDGFKIAGYETKFGLEKRYIKPEDTNKAFQIVLQS